MLRAFAREGAHPAGLPVPPEAELAVVDLTVPEGEQALEELLKTPAGSKLSVIAIAEVENPRITINGTPGESRLLKANTFGIGHIRVRETPSALVVPQSAVQWDGKRHIVFLARTETGVSETDHDDWILEAQPVAIGTMLDHFTEILTGLEEGDRVVADGSHMLKSELSRRLTQNVD